MSERKTKMIKVQLPASRLGKAGRSNAPSQGSEDSTSGRTKTSLGVIIQEIPIEVLNIIFKMLDRQDCAVAAVVCCRWSGVALDELWRSLPSLLPLFGLLGPLERTELGHDLHPEIVLTEKSWDLFKSYGARVRHLTYDEDGHLGISSGLIMRALAVHPEGGILPNLRAVNWVVNEFGLNHVLAFCPFSLERMHLHISSNDVEVDQVQRLLSCLSSSLANRLKFFGFGTDYLTYENAALSTALNTFIKTQHGLLGVEFPHYVIQDLETLTAVCQASPQLQTFCGEFMPEMFQVGMNALATRGPSLRCIRLVRAEAEEAAVSMADIEPLLQLSVVEDLALWIGCDLNLHVQDVQRMGQAWRKLASLFIYPYGEGDFPLSQLITFAESFPALERFAAPVDFTGEIPSANDVPARFKSLRRLLLFHDGIRGAKPPLIAEFLAMVCAPGVDITIYRYGPEWYEVLEGESVWAWDGSPTDLKEIRDWMASFYRVQEGIQRLR